MTKSPLSLYDLSFLQLQDFLKNQAQPIYRADQIWKGLYKHCWRSPSDFSNIPTGLRKTLEDTFIFQPLKIIDSINSKDMLTNKILYELKDKKYIETVLMHYKERVSLCISSQAGCPVGCIFCATGQNGFNRNLTKGEIIGQVVNAETYLRDSGKHLTNILVMGMGEPFLNYSAVMEAISILNAKEGFGLGARRFTISTVGIIPGIKKFTQEKSQVNLSISLHAANEELRTRLIPINKSYPLSGLMSACKEYVNVTHRRISFEWVMIDGINDTIKDANQLSKLLTGLLCHVNLIPLNPSNGFPNQTAKLSKITMFRRVLDESGINCTVRIPRGVDIKAGCGQLAAKFL